MQRFSASKASSLEVSGRVSSGGRKQSFVLSVESDGIIRCIGSDGFNVSIDVAKVLNSTRKRNIICISTEHINCVLDDGMTLKCEGHMSPKHGKLRLDALDQDDFAWFWLEIRPSFRSVLMN
jgi:hypothetical protein